MSFYSVAQPVVIMGDQKKIDQKQLKQKYDKINKLKIDKLFKGGF
ncbi:MAG: hypothetical protein ACI3Z7_07420 [Candidatus Aphodosoma sp.]